MHFLSQIWFNQNIIEKCIIMLDGKIKATMKVNDDLSMWMYTLLYMTSTLCCISYIRGRWKHRCVIKNFKEEFLYKVYPKNNGILLDFLQPNCKSNKKAMLSPCRSSMSD